TNIFIARNIVADSTIGIEVVGSDWIVAGNLIHDIQPSNSEMWGTMALFVPDDASYVNVQWNTIADSMNAYDDRADYVDTRCNTMIRTPGWGAGMPRGVSHVTAYNYLYEASALNFVGSSNQSFPTALASMNQTLSHKRTSGPGGEDV